LVLSPISQCILVRVRPREMEIITSTAVKSSAPNWWDSSVKQGTKNIYLKPDLLENKCTFLNSNRAEYYNVVNISLVLGSKMATFTQIVDWHYCRIC
jgi:hypothetical protein